MVTPTVRALALEPWKFAGQTVTVTGNFRGRNLFGDLPDAPGKGRYDFIVRGGEGSVWVTGLRPRGPGFDFDVDRRIDSNRWLEVTGPLVHDRGLVRIEATKIALAKAPDRSAPDRDEGAPVSAVPLTPAEIVFNSPTEGETDVTPDVQRPRPVLEGARRGVARGPCARELRWAPRRAPRARRSRPPTTPPTARSRSSSTSRSSRFRTVKIEILDGVTAFDGAPLHALDAHVYCRWMMKAPDSRLPASGMSV